MKHINPKLPLTTERDLYLVYKSMVYNSNTFTEFVSYWLAYHRRCPHRPTPGAVHYAARIYEQALEEANHEPDL